MPLAQIKVIEGVFSSDEKRMLAERVTEAILSVGQESMRDKLLVIIEEIKSGDWCFGGQALTTDAVVSLRKGG